MAAKAARGRKHQTKISFSSTAKPPSNTRPSPAANMSKEPVRPKQKTPSKAAPHTQKRTEKLLQLESSSDEELVLQTKRNMKVEQTIYKSNCMFGDYNVDSGLSSSDSEENKVGQSQAKPASRKRQRPDSSSAIENDEEPDVRVLRKKQCTVKVRGRETSEEEAPRTHNRKRATMRHSTPEDKLKAQTQPRSTRRRLAPRSSSSSEEEDVLVLPPQRHHTNTQVQFDSEEESELPKGSRKRTTRKASASKSEDQDEQGNDGASQSDEERQGNSEQDELKEDLAFLRSSPLPDRGRLRSMHGKPKNDRQKALEALKRKRAGINEPSPLATPKKKKPVVVDTDSSSDLEVIKEEPERDEQTEDDFGASDDDEGDDGRELNALDIFQEDEEDIEFIDHDTDSVIGQPTANADLDDLRLTLSLSRAKTSHLFKHAVEWMVMKKIHPAFNPTRNFYTLTFRKLDDEVNALAGSKFTSSAWSPEFTRAVRARPDRISNDISGIGDFVSPHCAACNRKNHPASWEVLLTGHPYDKDTLEPLEYDTDSDSDSSDSSLSASPTPHSNSEKPERDSSGENLLPESHRFHLGSTCHANAVVSHTLYHWRYHLYQWVKQYLAQQGHLTAEKLVKRDKWSDRKRQKAAIKIVDQMEDDGEIKKLWNMYKDQVKLAVDASNEYKEGWGKRGR